MLDIAVETENQQRHLRVTEQALSALVHRIGGERDRFLVVQRVPDLPGFFVQTWHEEGGSYRLECRAGNAASHVGVDLDSPDEVAGVMARWARQEPDWDAGIGWKSAGMPPEEEVPEPAREIREQLEARIRLSLRGGYGTVKSLTETAEDHLVKDGVRPVTMAQARKLVERLWLERVEEQAGWTDVTGADRVERAFAALDGRGITARENFTCCRSCGTGEIRSEGSEGARGFVFFHSQGTDAVAEGHGLALYYGGFDGSAETTAAVGREVAESLRASGLPVEWDGSPDSSILLPVEDWRKRLVG
ncbi:DUF6891 domain-containing protein [Streptomyces sp. NPDC059499]|uniref:DUF6891 domain-containing protein n=1 Tax=Streptomyces sp. NPDC059499 TaxID=3346852 RepID=UPI0036986B47